MYSALLVCPQAEHEQSPGELGDFFQGSIKAPSSGHIGA